jgi:hypothetical protein
MWAAMSASAKRSESGQSQPELRVIKEGDLYLRKMLVQGAHLILGRRAPTRVRREARSPSYKKRQRSAGRKCAYSPYFSNSN